MSDELLVRECLHRYIAELYAAAHRLVNPT